MGAMTRTMILLGCALLIAGCAAQRYQPAPISAASTAAQLESRSLTDDGLRSFIEMNLGQPVSQWPAKVWDLKTLSLAALYFNPLLDSSRALLARADAAILTAGARPNPTLGISPGFPSPYLMTLDFAVPIETAGKRGYRVARARNLDQAARLDLADSAWTVMSGIRVALLDHLLASRKLALLRSEEQSRADQLKILEQIRSAGEIPRFDVDVARVENSKTEMAIRAAEGQAAETRAALASAIGIPSAGLGDAEFSWPGVEEPPDPATLDAAESQRDAILNRLDLRRALSQYAAAENDLQLEIAKQYPDINIGPGYTYEETHHFFTVGVSSTLPLFNHNQGPIAEAEARRKEAAAALLQSQARVISQSERAFAGYAAALQELAAANSAVRLLEAQAQSIQQAIRSGADTRLSLDGAQIQLSVSAQARLEALGHAQRLLGDLEDAVQRPLESEGTFPIQPDSEALKDLARGAN
jgi:outer membrane protein TolC